MATLEAKVKHIEAWMKEKLHYTPLAGGAFTPAAGGQSKPSSGRSSRSRSRAKTDKKK